MNNTASNTGPRAPPNNPNTSNGNGTRQYIDITNNNNRYDFRATNSNNQIMSYFKKFK